MIVWSGFGFLIALIGIGALVGTEIIAEKITGIEHYYQANPWLILVGMLLAAAITFLANKTFLASQAKAVLDKETGQEIVLRKEHTLFFIPSKWWPVLFVGIGIAATITSYIK